MRCKLSLVACPGWGLGCTPDFNGRLLVVYCFLLYSRDLPLQIIFMRIS